MVERNECGISATEIARMVLGAQFESPDLDHLIDPGTHLALLVVFEMVVSRLNDTLEDFR